MRAALPLLVAAAVCLPAAASVRVPSSAPRVRDEPRWRGARVFLQPDGLPQNSVYSILQTHDGYVWVGTRGGVARFDGVRFVTFDDARVEQIKENEIWALTEGQDGSLWIGTWAGGVVRLKDEVFTRYTTRDGLVSDYVATLATGEDGTIWIGTDGGLSVLKDGRFTSYTVKNGLTQNAVRSLLLEPDGTVWIGELNGGLDRLKDGVVRAEKVPGLPPTAEVRALRRDRAGSLWIATTEGLFRRDDGGVTVLTRAKGLPSERVYSAHVDAQGNLWMGTDKGLAVYRDGRFEPAVSGETGALEQVTAIASDAEGSLWIGSLRDGLARLKQGLFTTFTAADGVGDDYTSAVLVDRRGRTWIGTANGLTRLADGRLRTFTVDRASNRVNTLTEDAEGRLWMGTFEGVYEVQEGACGGTDCPPRFRRLELPGAGRLLVRVLYSDPDGTLWIGTNMEGLLAYRDGRVTAYNTSNGLSNNAIRGLARDPDGSLWIGTRGGGLDRLQGGRFTVYREKDGLTNDNVQALYRDRTGALWVATRHGVSRFKDGRFTPYSVAQGLFNNFIYSFLEDDRGDLWMTCSKGIFHVPMQQLVEVAEGRRRTVISTAYGLEHGLATTVSIIAHYPASYRAPDGRLWFSTAKGVAVIDPRRITRNDLPPPVRIEEVEIDGRAVPAATEFHAPPGRGDLSLRYTALSFLAPEKMHFRYRLFAYDADWVDPGPRRVAYYTNIPPGRYEFKVAASNNDGVWNEKGASFTVVLAPHFHQTRTFYALCVMAAIGLGAATQQIRLRYLKARARMLSARVDEMVAEMKVMHGLLPICASCKKIRDDGGYWNQIESYISSHSEAAFSHSICPDCMGKLYPDYAAALERRRRAASSTVESSERRR
jgi:ligand-binding sensor domain-containing protein